MDELSRKHLRIAMLRLLHEAAGWSMNESLLHGHLKRLYFKVTRDQVRTELTWLHAQGLVAAAEEMGLMGAELTLRGSEVADGSATHPDVQRPSGRRP